VDELGRMVIPMNLRREMGIDVKDPMEIYVEDEKIILTKYEPACVFCGSTSNAQDYRGKLVCQSCSTAMFKKVTAK